jgi:glycerol uptake facilitator-like aquaporin
MLLWLRWWAELLDSKFRIPGTNIRFGVDPVLSLIPVLGELSTPMFTALVLTQALRQRLPGVVILRMIVNALIDAAIGAVPVAGTVADVFWRANNDNLALLQRHRQRERPPTKTDYVIFWGVVGLFGLAVGLLAIFGLWLTLELYDFLARLNALR